MSRSILGPILGGVIGAALLAGILAIGGVFDDPDPPPQPARTTAAPTPQQVYAGARGSVVMVRAKGVGEIGSEPEFGPPEEGPREATGSGFIIDRRGTIVTNAHVVGRSDAITVRFSDDGRA